MLLLFLLSAVFIVVVGWMIYYTITNQSDKCNQCHKPMNSCGCKRRCNNCRQLMPQCRCHKPCSTC